MVKYSFFLQKEEKIGSALGTQIFDINLVGLVTIGITNRDSDLAGLGVEKPLTISNCCYTFRKFDTF